MALLVRFRSELIRMHADGPCRLLSEIKRLAGASAALAASSASQMQQIEHVRTAVYRHARIADLLSLMD